MNKLAAVKTIAKFVVAGSTSFAVSSIVRNNVVPKSTFQRVELQIASVVIGYMVAEKAEEMIVRVIDKLKSTWDEAVQSNA